MSEREPGYTYRDDDDDDTTADATTGITRRAIVASVPQRIDALLVAVWPRWLSSLDLQDNIRASSVARRMREMMEDDRKAPPAQRRFEEREVPGTGAVAAHKEYRVIIQGSAPRLFD